MKLNLKTNQISKSPVLCLLNDNFLNKNDMDYTLCVDTGADTSLVDIYFVIISML